MTAISRSNEVAEIDRFLAEQKTVTDALPEWKDGENLGRWQAEWPVLDQDGIAREGTRLVFSCRKQRTDLVSIRLLLRGQQIYGIDLVVPEETKPNPPDAMRFGLPSRVSGSHFHRWDDNRDYALRVGPGSLPYRRPTPVHLSRLPHALASLAQATNLVLTPQQLSFDVPPQGYLLVGGEQ
jgi:hypothetical protein